MFKGTITFMQSIEITIISMIVVFAILAGLAFVLSLFKYLPADKPVAAPKKAPQKPVAAPKAAFDPSKITDERMAVAMLVASIEASGDAENTNIRVVGIKELN